MLGVTRRYGVDVPASPAPRRSAVGWLARRAQSRGEWPGSRVTLREGFAGLLGFVGGGARVDVPGCRSKGVVRVGRGEGRGIGGAERKEEEEEEEEEGGRREGGGGGGGGGGAIPGDIVDGGAEGFGALGIARLAVPRATAAAEAGGSIVVVVVVVMVVMVVEGDSEKWGMLPFATGVMEALAFGVVGDDGDDDREEEMAKEGMSVSTGLRVAIGTTISCVSASASASTSNDAICDLGFRSVSASAPPLPSALLTGAS